MKIDYQLQLPKKDTYIIFTSFLPNEIAKRMQELIADGYQPMGGPFVVGKLIHQAVILKSASV